MLKADGQEYWTPFDAGGPEYIRRAVGRARHRVGLHIGRMLAVYGLYA
jgi:hypothetical protein